MSTLISYVIPARDEAESVPLLYEEIIEVNKKLKSNFEIIFIDDGSTDDTFAVLKSLRQKDKRISIYKLRGNFGKSIALQVGFDNSAGDIIITLDADLQDNPLEIPKLLDKLNEDNLDLVSGWKKKRLDPKSKVIPSRILNFATSVLTGVKLHDINSGFKVYKKEVIKNIRLYGELYRFIPILAAKQNFRVGEVIVEHRKRKFGNTKYGIGRNVKGLLDLVTIIFLTGFMTRPGHFFGTIGLVSFTLGFIIGLYITYLRILTGSIQYRHPLLYLGMLLIIIGIQLLSTGLLAEMIIYTGKKEDNNSLIRKVLSKA